MGHPVSLEVIGVLFTRGQATKSQYEEALKGCQGAMEEMMSPDRKEAETSPLINRLEKR